MSKDILIYRTPIRKKIEGVLLLSLGSGLCFYWFYLGCPLTLVGFSLLIINSLVSLLGLYRFLSFQVVCLEKGSKVIKQLKLHLGFIKKENEYEVDNITLFANDLYAFTWAVFAYKGEMNPREVLPENRLIIIDCISGKRAKQICCEIDNLCPIIYRSSKK